MYMIITGYLDFSAKAHIFFYAAITGYLHVQYFMFLVGTRS